MSSQCRSVPASSLPTACCLLPTAQEFERIVIDANFPGAYQVEVADVNGDKKPDVIAVGGSTCAWYENPTWKKRIVTGAKQTPGIISSATADLDGDGKAEIAIAYEFAMNTPDQGQARCWRCRARRLDDPWKLVPIADVGSIHRLRWGDVTATGSSTWSSRRSSGQSETARIMRIPPTLVAVHRDGDPTGSQLAAYSDGQSTRAPRDRGSIGATRRRAIRSS